MAVCISCGLENRADARFCGRCGGALARACLSCGVEVDPGLAFCTACGARVDGAPPASTHVLGDERKVVTVLFADLVGFTAGSERLDPEYVRGALVPYYARLRRELEHFGGTVEKFIGDAVMALFGAPVAHEDDPERAVRAALAIRDATIELNAAGPALDLQLRIAVNTGEALVATRARPSEGETMATGDVVNTCARLQAAAPVNGILVGEATFRATRRSIAYREAEPVVAKGKSEPIPVWVATGLRADTGVDRIRRSGAPLVGRRREVDLLAEALDRARRERKTQFVTLVGVPGIGKSRLVFELFRLAEAEPELMEWRQGRSLPYGGASFWALTEMAKALVGIDEDDDAAAAAAKLGRATVHLARDAAEARWLEEHLRPLVGLEGGVGGDRRAEAFAAWRRFFEAVAERGPLVLVFEDLHWADEGLLDFVDYLVEWSAELPLLVVATTRPEIFELRPDWAGGKRNAITVSLAPLSPAETETLVAALVGRAVLPADVHETLLARAEGNPLYAEEYMRMLTDRGFLRREVGMSRLERADALPLPESVQGIIAARLDALQPEEKALLHDAAVLGREFWVSALAALRGGDPVRIEERLHALERKELVRRERHSTVPGEQQYAFGHALVRDVAYAQIARSLRSEQHVRAAEWFEALGARADVQVEVVAQHYLSALELARATGHDTSSLADRARVTLNAAGDRASTLNAAPAAARFYTAALALWPEDDADRADLLFRTGTALAQAEEGGAEALAEARDGFLARGDHERAAEAEVLLYRLASNRGRRDEGLRHLERAVELVADAAPSRSKATVLCNLARFRMLSGENAEAVRVGAGALAMAEELQLDDLQAEALDSIGVARFVGGDPGGVDDLERALEVARDRNSPETVRSLKFFGGTLVLLGELERSAALFDEGLAAAERFGDAYNIRWLRALRTMQLYWVGDWDDALRAADAFCAEAAVAPHYMEATTRRVRGQIRLARGETAAAMEDAQRALESDRTAQDPWFLNASLAFCARAFLVAGRDEEAAALADELLAIWSSGARVASFEAGDLAAVLVRLGRDATAVVVKKPTRWVEAARAFVAGDGARAAETFERIGSLPDAAYARLRAAANLAPAERNRELEPALAFLRSVGADAYVREGEALAAPVAGE